MPIYCITYKISKAFPIPHNYMSNSTCEIHIVHLRECNTLLKVAASQMISFDRSQNVIYES